MAEIYKITNTVNSKSYIGKTEKTHLVRFKEHMSEARKDRCKNRPLYKAMNKYGHSHFTVELLEKVSSEQACIREIFWIEYYGSYQKGYNATLGGDGITRLDINLILATYAKELNISATRKLTGHDIHSIRAVLIEHNVEIKDQGYTQRIPVTAKDSVGNKIDFLSMSLAAQFLISMGYSKSNVAATSGKISQVCSGQRKSAYGYFWSVSQVV